MKKLLLLINSIILAVGCCGGQLILRLYFVRGGQMMWFASWLQSAGWPIILFPLFINYTRRRQSSRFFSMKSKLFVGGAVVGIITGVSNYTFAYGESKLPVSTSSLIVPTELVFTVVFSFLIVKQKFTAYSINAVVLLTVGSVVLALHSNGDRPMGESNKEYALGFIAMVGSSLTLGLSLPLVEFFYLKSGQSINYTLILEFQLVLNLFATIFCTIGVLVKRDFQSIHDEALGFQLGVTRYYAVIIFIAIISQCFTLGMIGVIHYSSSLFSGILITLLIPVTEVLAVVFFHDKFQVEKGISLFLSLWGFLSYFYGEFKMLRRHKPDEVCTGIVAPMDATP